MGLTDRGSGLARYFAASGVSQAHVARTVGISPSHLGRIVRGEITPRLDLAIRISDATGVPVREILTEEEK